MSGTAKDVDMEALVRGLASAQADAAEARVTLRGDRAKAGVLTEVELLKSQVRQGDERVTETRELFGALFRQLDTKMDAVLAALKLISNTRLNPMVVAFIVACACAVAMSSVVIAGIVAHAYASMVEHSRVEDQ